jgi:hypothetical protein
VVKDYTVLLILQDRKMVAQVVELLNTLQDPRELKVMEILPRQVPLKEIQVVLKFRMEEQLVVVEPELQEPRILDMVQVMEDQVALV